MITRTKPLRGSAALCCVMRESDAEGSIDA